MLFRSQEWIVWDERHLVVFSQKLADAAIRGQRERFVLFPSAPFDPELLHPPVFGRTQLNDVHPKQSIPESLDFAKICLGALQK